MAKKRRALLGTAAAVTTCAVVGSFATQPRSQWYLSLKKPAWQPPPAAFPIVWTTLYAAIAVASGSVLQQLEDQGRTAEATAFRRALGTNLALNAGWSFVFFRSRQLPASTLAAVVLAASSADLARRATRHSKPAGLLLGLYAAWTQFATALAAAVWLLNRADQRDS